MFEENIKNEIYNGDVVECLIKIGREIGGRMEAVAAEKEEVIE
jgi:hypothetical protein